MIALLDNQSKAISKLDRYKVGALFMGTGTGKTRTLVELVNSASGIDKVFYFAPYSAIHPPAGVSSIVNEVNKWGGFICPVKYIGVESIGMSDRIYLDTLSELSGSASPFLVIDESIKIKNWEARRTKRLLKISCLAEYKLIANATPITKNILDVWAQMEFLSPKILNMSRTHFENTFCRKTIITKVSRNKKTEKTFISGYENIDHLYSLIGHYVYESELEVEIGEQASDILYSIQDKSIYYELKERYLSEDTLFWKNNNIFLEMTQKMQHSYSCDPDKLIKIKKELEGSDMSRVAFYCKYIDSQQLCRKTFEKSLVLSYQKNSLSINLQHDFDVLVFWDKIWDYYLVKQAKGRIKRQGRVDPVKYISLTGDVGLERLIDKNIKKKTSMADYLKKVSLEQLREDV